MRNHTKYFINPYGTTTYGKIKEKKNIKSPNELKVQLISRWHLL